MRNDQGFSGWDEIEVPIDRLKKEEKRAMQRTRQARRQRRTGFLPSIVACSAVLFLFAASFSSSGLAGSLVQIPVVGPIYEKFSDLAAEKITKEGLSAPVGKQTTVNGLTMEVKEAAYDGNRLLVDVIYTGENRIGEDEILAPFESSLLINGEEPEVILSGSSMMDRHPLYSVVQHFSYTFPDDHPYGEEIAVTVAGKDMFDYEGELSLEFQIKKIKAEPLAYQPEAAAVSDDGLDSISVKRVSFFPLSTRIDLDIESSRPADRQLLYSAQIKDDSGRLELIRQGNVTSMDGRRFILELPPSEVPPQSITIVGESWKGKNTADSYKVIELTIPLAEEDRIQ